MLKNLFKKKNKGIAEEDKSIYDRYLINSEVVYKNDCVEIVHDSCKICYNRGAEPNFEAKANYIRKQIGHGHESILEHSNVISKIVIPEMIDASTELAEFLTLCRYLNTKVKVYNGDTIVIIGGSIRGYKHILRMGDIANNRLVEQVMDIVYKLNSCFFPDLIKDNILDVDAFMDLNPEEVLPKYTPSKVVKSTEKYDILHIDDFTYIQKALNHLLSDYEMMDFVSLNILFKDVSRTCSHQLVRHRGGITQLSQRYVDMTGAKFISPAESTHNLDKDAKYIINFGNYDNECKMMTQSFTLQELGDFLSCNIYPQLREQGLLKEDARAFLPSNTNTSLYMTFTWRGFIKFLELRTDKHSQAEIRVLATDLKEDFEPVVCDNTNRDMFAFIMPLYQYLDEFVDIGIDEVISEEDVNE